MGDDGWQKMPSLISPATTRALSAALKNLVADQSIPFATVLHGGEPLMLGARKLRELLKSLRESLPGTHPICMQTNGMLITDEILQICTYYSVSISVSIDGPKLINDQFRIDHKGKGTFDKIVAGITLLREHEAADFLFAGLLCVINPHSAPSKIYTFLKDLGARSIDFLYRDGNHSVLPFGKESFDSTEYGDWLCTLLTIYLSDRTAPKIRFLDDLIRLELGSTGTKEGLGMTDYGIAIIETDGTITKNDTLKSTFNGADQFNENWSIYNHRLSEVFNSDEFKQYYAMQRASSSTCLSCEYLNTCGGGMPLHRWSNENSYDNPSIYCSDQKKIINTVRNRLRTEGLVA
jgi:uncharacterized protein